MDTVPDMTSCGLSRRKFVAGASALGACSLISVPLRASAEPPPETTKLTLLENPVTCLAPQYVAKELLHGEGFTDVRYLKWPTETKNWAPEVFLSEEADIGLTFVPSDIVQIAAGAPVVILGGSHIGCVELMGGPRVKSARDLTGKTVAIAMPRSDEQIFISMFAKYVGLNPNDINWVVHQGDHWQLLAEGKIDAYMSGPPGSIELRQRKIGHVLGQYDGGHALVPLFLLSGGEYQRIRPQAPDRNQARSAGNRKSRRRVRPRTQPSRTPYCRQRSSVL